MRIITNYWPDPRFVNAKKLSLNGCVIASHNAVFNPSSSSFPGVSLKATRDGDNWAELDLKLDAGMAIIVACLSGGSATSTDTALNVWNGPTRLASCPLGGGTSEEFTVPISGTIKVCLRAPNVNGNVRHVMNVFVGTKDDYTALQRLVSGGFLAGDLMPRA